jgi:hypothetical protein
MFLNLPSGKRMPEPAGVACVDFIGANTNVIIGFVYFSFEDRVWSVILSRQKISMRMRNARFAIRQTTRLKQHNTI